MVTLTEQMKKDGADLIAALDDMDVDISAAFWSYFSDFDDWKLLISMPKEKGPTQSYKTVQKALHSNHRHINIEIDQISVIKPDTPIIGLLRSAVSTGPGISSIRFSNNVIKGQMIEDVLIYRIT